MRMWAVPFCVLASTMAADTALAQVELPVSVAGTAQSADSAAVEMIVRFQGAVTPQLDLTRLVRMPGETDWRLAGRARMITAGGVTSVHGTAGIDTLLVMRGAGQQGYLLAGPLRWPLEAATLDVPVAWRRTVRGRWPRFDSGTPLWLGGQPNALPSNWPMCSSLERGAWECIGVPLDSRGVIISLTPGETLFGIALGTLSAAGVELVPAASAGWGRLLVVARADRAPVSQSDAIVAAARKLQIPPGRRLPSRAYAETDARVRIDKLDERVFWVSGTDAPADTWLEIEGSGRSPARLAVPALAGASADIPVHVDLEAAASIAGRVTDSTGAAAPGTIVALYRLIPDSSTGQKRSSRRVSVAETTTDEDGAFRFGDLAGERHDLLAFHVAKGRAERTVDPDGLDVEITLRPPSQATGRVIRDGVPAAGIRIATVPDMAAFATSEDVTELLGGETSTDRDGQFMVALAPRGTIELRIGDETTGVRRVALGNAESLPRLVDVGTIELGPLPPLTLVLEQSGGCELLLTGPMERLGLTVQSATRVGPSLYRTALPEPGSWLIAARCAGRPRALIQSIVEVPAGAGEQTVHLAWR